MKDYVHSWHAITVLNFPGPLCSGQDRQSDASQLGRSGRGLPAQDGRAGTTGRLILVCTRRGDAEMYSSSGESTGTTGQTCLIDGAAGDVGPPSLSQPFLFLAGPSPTP